MKAAIVLEVFCRPFGSLGAAEEQDRWKALVRRRLSDADDPKLFKRCRDQIERAHDVCLSTRWGAGAAGAAHGNDLALV